VSDELCCFELRYRLVGEPDPVAFAEFEHPHDDFEQTLVGDEGIGNCAGPAQLIRSNGIGIADYFDVHDPQPALDQHDLSPPIRTDKARRRAKVPFRETCFAVKNKAHRSGNPGRCAWEVTLTCGPPVF